MKAKLNGEVYEVVSKTLRETYILRSTETYSKKRYTEANIGLVERLKFSE